MKDHHKAAADIHEYETWKAAAREAIRVVDDDALLAVHSEACTLVDALEAISAPVFGGVDNAPASLKKRLLLLQFARIALIDEMHARRYETTEGGTDGDT
jgi:predicted alpha/beta hydrolase family esterase